MAEAYDLEFIQSERFVRRLRYKPDGTNAQSFTDYDLYAQVRVKEDPASALVVDLSDYMTVVDGDDAVPDSVVVFDVPGSVTATFTTRQFKTAAWCLFMVETANPANSDRIIEGAATLDLSPTVVYTS